MLKKENLLLYAITDSSNLGEFTLEEKTELALKGGATMIQLREKHADPEAFLRDAIKIKEICRRYSAPLIINDNPEIALKAGADGVHLGQGDMDIKEARKLLGDNAIIGITARTPEQAAEAERNGADYLGSGAVFGTSTKADAKPMSKETLKKICETVKIPVVAIGGINETNAPQLKGTGIAGIAVVSAIYSSDEPEKAARELKEIALGVTEDEA